MNQPVVILSREGSIYGGIVVERVLQAGLNVAGVILQRWGTKQKYSRWKSYVRKHGLATVLFSKGVEYLDNKLISGVKSIRTMPVEHVLEKCSVPTFRVPTLNGKQTLNCLDKLQPALVLLSGVGIISAKLIEKVSIPFMNAHSGIVPAYRGNYAIRWALLNSDPVGITVHLVDAGIDTGPVLSITPVNLTKTRSLAVVENHVDHIRAELLAKESKRFLAGEISPVHQELHSDQPLYSIMPPGNLLRTYRVLRHSSSHKGRCYER